VDRGGCPRLTHAIDPKRSDLSAPCQRTAGSFYFSLDKIPKVIKIFVLFNFVNNSITWR
jgi:hypothetical protein